MHSYTLEETDQDMSTTGCGQSKKQRLTSGLLQTHHPGRDGSRHGSPEVISQMGVSSSAGQAYEETETEITFLISEKSPNPGLGIHWPRSGSCVF